MITDNRRPDLGRSVYPEKANPNRPQRAGAATSSRGRGSARSPDSPGGEDRGGAAADAGGQAPPAPVPPARGGNYPEKCNPQHGREPLTEDQRGLATRYMPLARALARRQRPVAFDREELEAAAYMALVEAAQSFDPTRNVHFATYARHRIRGALRDSLRFRWDAGWSGAGPDAPVFQRLATGSDLRGWVIGKQPVPPTGAALETTEEVEHYLRRLPRVHAQACRFLYIDGKSQDEAAALLGCSKSYLSRLHRDAIDWLIRDLGGDPSSWDRPPCATAS